MSEGQSSLHKAEKLSVVDTDCLIGSWIRVVVELICIVLDVLQFINISASQDGRTSSQPLSTESNEGAYES